jgi:hypothetical protein
VIRSGDAEHWKQRKQSMVHALDRKSLWTCSGILCLQGILLIC